LTRREGWKRATNEGVDLVDAETGVEGAVRTVGRDPSASIGMGWARGEKRGAGQKVLEKSTTRERQHRLALKVRLLALLNLLLSLNSLN
jgi:hypothetical protein